jgi:hypothetical protein
VRTPECVKAHAFAENTQKPRPEVPLTMFMFGYWGCGGATKELVAAVNAAEAARGFAPPLWVDIRIRRAVRAAGVSGDAFEKLVGDQYIWMRDLGNASVLDHGSEIRIKEPAAAKELLGLAVRNPARRVIFFCACEWAAGCHRTTVAKLVMKAARNDNVDVTLIEWPGGEPRDLNLTVNGALFRKIARGSQTSLPVAALPKTIDSTTIPWGSTLTLTNEDDGATATVLSGPARFDYRGAYLPILEHGASGGDAGDLLRDERGFAELE